MRRFISAIIVIPRRCLIPGDALISTNTGLQVAVLEDAPGAPEGAKKIHMAPVGIGRDYGRETEITSGLQGSEVLVINPGDEVREGALVKAEISSEGRGGSAVDRASGRVSKGSQEAMTAAQRNLLSTAVALICLLALPLCARNPNDRTPSVGYTSGLLGAYKTGSVSEPDYRNSTRIRDLIRAGQLYLSLQDTIALALENNLDLELERYGVRMAATDTLRAKGGGATTWSTSDRERAAGGPWRPGRASAQFRGDRRDAADNCGGQCDRFAVNRGSAG